MASKTTRTGASPDDAIAALTADHEKVKKLFKQFQKLKDDEDADEEKAALVAQICTELTIHTALEEELFYPAVRAEIDDDDLMDEALVEHAGAKNLIEQLQAMSPDDDLFDAKVTVLCEQINHHVEEEEGAMFPKAKKAGVDTAAVGAQIAQRRSELKNEIGEVEEEDGAASLPSERSASKVRSDRNPKSI